MNEPEESEVFHSIFPGRHMKITFYIEVSSVPCYMNEISVMINIPVSFIHVSSHFLLCILNSVNYTKKKKLNWDCIDSQ